MKTRGRYTCGVSTMAIPMHRFALALLLMSLCIALAACGQKGPLVRPGSAKPATAHSAAQAPAPELPTPNPDDSGR